MRSAAESAVLDLVLGWVGAGCPLSELSWLKLVDLERFHGVLRRYIAGINQDELSDEQAEDLLRLQDALEKLAKAVQDHRDEVFYYTFDETPWW